MFQMRCSKCEYYAPMLGNAYFKNCGACHRNPPQRTSDSFGQTKWSFPTVRENWFCGDYKKADGPKKTLRCADCKMFISSEKAGDMVGRCRLKSPKSQDGLCDMVPALFPPTHCELWCGEYKH